MQAQAPMAQMAAYERQQVLDHCVLRFRERAEELAQACVLKQENRLKMHVAKSPV